MFRTCSFFSLLFLSMHVWAQSQPLGSEWIDYRQAYLKIPVAEPGICRITSAELQRAGLPTATVDPTTIQLFHRGVEQAIYVAGESDKCLDPADFVEFYGRGNDGAPDSLLYRPASAQPHQYYSLFSDTAAYFLTWRSDQSTGTGKLGKRMVSYADTNYTGLIPEPYHWAEELRVFADTYPGYPNGIPPKIEYSDYEAGEGYTGVVQQRDVPYELPFVLDNTVRTGPAPRVDLLLAGRDYTNHHVECLAGASPDARRGVGTTTFSVYDNARIRQELVWSDVGTDGRLVVSTVSRGDGPGPDRYSVSYAQLRYPQKISTDGQPRQTFRLTPNESGRSLMDMGAVPADTRFWDITDLSAPIRLGFTVTPAGSARLVVRGTEIARTILRSGQPKPALALQPVTFTDWTNRRPTYLIVSHESLMRPAVGTTNAVRSYTAYRASAAGGGHDTLVATMRQLFDRFSYGERHPLAIRRFADYLLRQSNGSSKKPQFLLLLGRSRSTPGIRRNPAQATLDMVMTAGHPGSDIVFTAGLNGFPADVPALMTGRVNAGTPQEVVDYLNKVREYERPSADALWRKNVLHLSGGKTPGESVQFRRLMDGYRDQAVAQSLGARVSTLAKATDNPVERIDVAGPVNEGVGLMTFFGHSGLDVTDLDIGFCSSDAFGYRNKGKYPFLLINGCAIGNFFFGRPTLATDWVLTPDRGAIAALAHTHLGYVSYLNGYTMTFYNLLTDSTSLNKSIGYLQQETIRRVLTRTSDGQALANCQQMVLQGDPAIRLFPFATPDYGITAGGLTVRGADDEPLTTGSDSVRIRAVVQNSGQYRPGPLPVRVRRFVDGRESGVFNLTVPRSVAYRDTLTLTTPNQREAGPNQFSVTINPDGAVPETNQSDNSADIDVTVAGRGPVLIYPPDSGTVNTRSVRLAAESFSISARTFEVEVDTTSRFDSPALMTQRVLAGGSIAYPVTLTGPARTRFHWRVRAVNDSVWANASFLFDPASTAAGLPEGQIRLAGKLPTDVRQGDVVTISVQFINLSPYPFVDSLIVRQTLYAAGLTNPQTIGWTVKAPVGSDTLRVETRIATERLPGINRVLLTVNPRLQPEYSFLNNTLDLLLPVQPDALGPLLEVAIDGARIDDNAVVSARPVIDVLIADDNRSLIRRDTAGVDLYLQRAGQNQPIDQRNNRLNWRSATMQPTGADNVFRIRYLSVDLSKGAYRLLVTARDAVGNPATPYRVNFRVVNERGLTNLTVSPNPFRDRVEFTFQLTGRQAPDALTITIRDLTGRIVRQGRMAGRIGRNEWIWNGQSDDGTSLPAGLYLYHLTISDDGHDWPVADGVTETLRGRLILTR